MISKIFNTQSISQSNETVLLFWQKKIFKSLFVFLLIVGSIPYILSCKYAVESSEWYRIIFYTLIYLWAASVTFIEKIPFPIRLWAGISGFYLLGLFSMISTGITGSTRGYLLCFSAFAAIFSGMRAGLITLCINIATMIMFGFLFFNDSVLSDPLLGEIDPMGWIVITGTFSFLCGAVTIVLAVVIRGVEISAKEYKHLIKNSSDLIWAMDRNHTITFVNASALPMLGFTQEEMIGKPMKNFMAHFESQFMTQLEEKGTQDIETVLTHKNGTPIDVEISGSKINPFPKSQNIYQGLIRDISQKKRREHEEEQIKEKRAQAEKLEALGILAGSVAHDLNNILSGIATYPEILMMDTSLDPKIRQGLSLIQDSGKKASAVVSDLLTVSRGSSAQKEILNLNSIIDRYSLAHDFQKIKQTYPRVKIEIATEPELLNIKGSYIHLEKTIMNLVLNAVEEVAQKLDGHVLITTENNYIDTATPGYDTVIPGEYVILQVADNGSGIQNEHLKNIFDPFFTKKEMGKSGTGLGLTVVWNAVQDHDGYIFVHSDGKGTRFNVLYPAVRQEVQVKTPAWSMEEIKGIGQFILVVDDLKEQQDIALTILDSLGYNAKAVDNGYEAVEFIKSHPADLVILDMIMAPSISGLETYRMMNEIYPGQKAIIASGYSESNDVSIAQELGAGCFVKKPYTVLDMGIAIKEELEK